MNVMHSFCLSIRSLLQNYYKRETFSITTGLAGLAYEAISTYLNWKKNKPIKQGYKAMHLHQNVMKNR